MTVRLVATDLDGTALRQGLEVSPRVAAAIKTVERSGIDVVFVTARNWRSVEVIAASAQVRGFAICSNGAVVYDLDTRAVVTTHPIDHEVLASFMELGRNEVAGIAFAWETAHETYREQFFPATSPPLSPVYLRSLQIAEGPRPDDDVTKVMAGHPELDSGELFDRLRSSAPPGLTLAISGPYFLEITGAGVTKALTLASLCHTRGIDAADVVAIGDQLNDLPMLLWAGRAVAMANSHPDVLAAVAEHTATNLNDGVALVLEGLATD